uniref:Uncharacterized protein n=1 Tax=Desulfovibrio sp. U5L TaxID=596152 RepID=I2Q3X0_9BACT
MGTPLPPLSRPDGQGVPRAGAPAGLLSRLCFDREDHALLRIVDDVLARGGSSSLKRLLASSLHPHGIKEMAAPRGLRMAYATIHLLGSLEAGLAGDRLTALRSLRDEVTATAESGLEKNTARVLLQIMKELVRTRENPRRQLELAHDFRLAVTGKPRVVRRLLAEFHLLEMPEAWNQDAFDDHVHDANTKGRKSPTHLIMDAWIKGIRRLTVIHYHFVRQETAAELLEAAAIMDMAVDIGIECLARHEGRLVKIIWTPRGLSQPEDFSQFLARPGVRAFMRQGFDLSLRWQRHVLAVLAAFNDRHRLAINERHGFALPPLDPEEFLAFVGAGQASILHLARFIHDNLQPFLDARAAESLAAAGKSPDSCAFLAERDALDTEALLETYLSPEANPGIPLPEEAGPGETLPERLSLTPAALVEEMTALHCDNRLTLVTAEMALADVLSVLFACKGAISHCDIFNLRVFETTGHDTGETLALLSIVNTGNVVALKRLLVRTADRLDGPGGDPAKAARLRALLPEVASLVARYRKHALGSRIGTDSAGQSTRSHGMGLVVADTLTGRARNRLARREKHPRLSLRRAIPVGLMVSPRVTTLPDEFASPLSARFFRFLRGMPGFRLAGYRSRLSWVRERSYKATAETANIHTLGGVQPKASERFQAEAEAARRTTRLTVRTLNGTLKNTLKILVGFAVAAASFATVHSWWVLAWLGPFIWFGITGLRNVLQAVLGCGGFRGSPLLTWKDYVRFDRLADSLLFTGFSVPLLDILVRTVLLDRGLGITTATNPLVLFAAMALANGLYLASHNLFRGLPQSAAVGNLFRSVLSIPLALGLNQGLAWILWKAGVADPAAALEPFAAIVSKFASDCVAAGIEGLADRGRYVRMRLRDYRDKFRQLYDTYSLLETLYPSEDVAKLLETPKAFISALGSDKRDLDKIVIVNALDFLYFWMYQPRARTVLDRAIRAMTLEERRVFFLSQLVLKREKEISRLFIDGLVGRKFAPALSFYLSNWRRYLDDIEGLIGRHPPAEALSRENALLGLEGSVGGP